MLYRVAFSVGRSSGDQNGLSMSDVKLTWRRRVAMGAMSVAAPPAGRSPGPAGRWRPRRTTPHRHRRAARTSPRLLSGNGGNGDNGGIGVSVLSGDNVASGNQVLTNRSYNGGATATSSNGNGGNGATAQCCRGQREQVMIRRPGGV